MLVRAKQSTDSSVIKDSHLFTKLGPPLNELPLRRYHQRDRTLFSPQWVPDVLATRVAAIEPDIVHLHWTCNGFLQIETLAKFQRPLVWTLHDMWPFTGGCHYTQTCDRYFQTCGACPQLHSRRQRDLSRWIWQRKAKAWSGLDLTLVAPSTWLADCAAASSLFQSRRIEVIPHGLDVDIYKPIERSQARALLNLPLKKPLVLFGAAAGVTNDPRKGFLLLSSALEQLGQSYSPDALELVIFGTSQAAQPLQFHFKTHFLGRLHDDLTLAILYSAADVMIVPSTQEAFGQTASEAMACGTPVVAFNATGLQDIVNHQQTGYLAKPFEAADLAQGIVWVLQDPERYQILSAQARQKAKQNFTLGHQAQDYRSLLSEIVAERDRSTLMSA
jgi:glycosyltransferase involved in cell wall biosynthesis